MSGKNFNVFEWHNLSVLSPNDNNPAYDFLLKENERCWITVGNRKLSVCINQPNHAKHSVDITVFELGKELEYPPLGSLFITRT